MWPFVLGHVLREKTTYVLCRLPVNTEIGRSLFWTFQNTQNFWNRSIISEVRCMYVKIISMSVHEKHMVISTQQRKPWWAAKLEDFPCKIQWKNQHINAPNFTNNASIPKSLGVFESLEQNAFVCCVCGVTTQILGCSISRNVTQHKRLQMNGSLSSNHR